MRVGVFGAGGRMGSTVCRAVAEDPDLELVAAVDPRLAGIDIYQVADVRDSNVQVEGDAEALLRAHAQVAVDFTEVAAARVASACTRSVSVGSSPTTRSSSAPRARR